MCLTFVDERCRESVESWKRSFELFVLRACVKCILIRDFSTVGLDWIGKVRG